MRWYVYMIGGSIGGWGSDAMYRSINGRPARFIKDFNTSEAAKRFAKEMRNRLSKGEKNYYKITYRVIKEN